MWTRFKIVFLLFVLCVGVLPRSPVLVGAFQPPSLAEELGCSPTLSLLFGRYGEMIYFDPFGLGKDRNFARHRESELKHGRVAMLAVVATSLPPILPAYHSAAGGGGGGGDWWTIPREDPSGGILLHLQAVTPLQYLEMMLTCGVIELFLLKKRNHRDMPGDYGIGYFGVRDYGLHERSLVSELENGRLAMMVFFGQLVAECVTGSPWEETWHEVFLKIASTTSKVQSVDLPIVNDIVNDIINDIIITP